MSDKDALAEAPRTEAGKRLLADIQESIDAGGGLHVGACDIRAIEDEAARGYAIVPQGERDAEREALDAGTHEPAVDDFGNQYLAPAQPDESRLREALGFERHPFTCSMCMWGRDGAYHSQAEYDAHMAATHRGGRG